MKVSIDPIKENVVIEVTLKLHSLKIVFKIASNSWEN